MYSDRLYFIAVWIFAAHIHIPMSYSYLLKFPVIRNSVVKLSDLQPSNDDIINNSSPLLTEEEEFDDYSDLFDFSKTLDSFSESLVINQNLLINEPPKIITKETDIKDDEKNKKNERYNLPFWNDKYEKVFYDIEDDLTEKDMWLQPIRDFIELRRGKAIWSKKSDQEIQREMKRSQMNKGLTIPSVVAQVINAVYLDKTHKMREYKAVDELACFEFRKWVTQQKKKTKKDPVLLAKLEVCKEWINTHPMYSLAVRPQKSRRTAPLNKKRLNDLILLQKRPITLTVMDDVIIYPSYKSMNTPNITFANNKHRNAQSTNVKNSRIDASKVTNSTTYQSTSNWQPINTFSMIHWDKNYTELPVAERASYDRMKYFEEEMIRKNKNMSDSLNGLNNRTYSFMIDENEEMFVANHYDEEYFVVI